ncbi:TraB/GumN family protein [Oryzifoliimicrobium ureilyticus]|uniref:TraB/GumN family protein n=1 Tax=Oryzifoliimicrobium ureilyticus TaxID=3113724 RepID=UPI00307634BE
MSLSIEHRTLRRRQAGDVLLWLIAGFHLLLLAALLAAVVTVKPANAAQEPQCRGVDLLAEMKGKDPAGYEKIMQEAAATPNGQGVLWKIEKPGISPSFLLGTMHVTDERVVNLSDKVQSAYRQANTVVIESDEILDEKKVAAAFLARPDLTMYTDGTTLASLLSKDNFALLDEGLKKRGIPAAAVQRMRPWMLMSVLSVPSCEIARKAAGKQFLDQKLAVSALKDGKVVKGLETMIEQAETMVSVPDKTQLKSVIDTLKLGDKMNDVVETMTDLYLQENSGAIVPMLKAVNASPEDPEGDDDFEQRVIIDRNKRMAERAQPILEAGNALIAVGFLHLPGKQGLIERLRAEGFTVTAVD